MKRKISIAIMYGVVKWWEFADALSRVVIRQDQDINANASIPGHETVNLLSFMASEIRGG